jgi:hypothetical protein
LFLLSLIFTLEWISLKPQGEQFNTFSADLIGDHRRKPVEKPPAPEKVRTRQEPRELPADPSLLKEPLQDLVRRYRREPTPPNPNPPIALSIPDQVLDNARRDSAEAVRRSGESAVKRVIGKKRAEKLRSVNVTEPPVPRSSVIDADLGDENGFKTAREFILVQTTQMLAQITVNPLEEILAAFLTSEDGQVVMARALSILAHKDLVKKAGVAEDEVEKLPSRVITPALRSVITRIAVRLVVFLLIIFKSLITLLRIPKRLALTRSF